jgi:hypothetical protein
VRTGYSETGLKYGMIVSNSCRKLVIKGLTKRETNEWIDCIQQVMNTTGIYRRFPYLPNTHN